MLENTQALFTTMARLAVVRFAEPGERVVEVAVDPELGGEGFTFRLASGREGSVHMDQVLDCDVDLVVRAKIA
jgi:hypothetical protein